MNRKPVLTACLAFFVVISASAFARLDDEPAAKPRGELAKFQGRWTGKFGPDDAFQAKVKIIGKEMELKILTPDDQEFILNGEIKLDDKAKPFKALDLTKFKSAMGDDLADMLGIYTFEDEDTIKLCLAAPSNPRPTEFKSEGRGQASTTLRRVGAKAKKS